MVVEKFFLFSVLSTENKKLIYSANLAPLR